MKVKIEVPIDEIKGESTAVGQKPLLVESHWNENGWDGLVVITTPKGEQFSVRGRILESACERCMKLA